MKEDKASENFSNSLRGKILIVRKKIEELESLPEFEKILSNVEEEQKNLIQQKGDTEKQLKQTQEGIGRIILEIDILTQNISLNENRITKPFHQSLHISLSINI